MVIQRSYCKSGGGTIKVLLLILFSGTIQQGRKCLHSVR